MHAFITLGLGIAIAFIPVPASAMRFADVLTDHSPPGGNLVQNPATEVLGPPDGIVAQFQEVDLTTPGFVTVEFTGSAIEDAPGNDFFIHLIDWTVSENEIFSVFASLGGEVFESIGSSGIPTGSAEAPITIGFDLASANLSSASFIKIVNGRIATSCCESPDIDAISAIPEPSTLILLAFGLSVLAVRIPRT